MALFTLNEYRYFSQRESHCLFGIVINFSANCGQHWSSVAFLHLSALCGKHSIVAMHPLLSGDSNLQFLDPNLHVLEGQSYFSIGRYAHLDWREVFANLTQSVCV